ncbi:hypothetical protein [Smaragdicoccus niigatensis]|uniref:hypothetical protein n=1 Tax=Smaragdicoccus niigatensis TaxID=359359 RepID=UPI0012DCB820|nr:hypothetical protein [Smaragdicoccus niigatensis]
MSSAQMSHSDFARSILGAAMAPERVARMVNQVLGDGFTVDPTPVGPVGLAVASARGVPGTVRARCSDDPHWDVNLTVPVALRVKVALRGAGLVPAKVEYQIRVIAHTRLRLLLESPGFVVVDVETVRREDVEALVVPLDIPSRLVAWVGKVNSVVAESVVTYFNRLVHSPKFADNLRFDVLAIVERAFAQGLPVASLKIAERAG